MMSLKTLAALAMALCASPVLSQSSLDADAEAYSMMLLCTGAAADEYHAAGDDPVRAVSRAYTICAPEVDTFVAAMLKQPRVIMAQINAKMTDATAARLIFERQVFPLKVALVDQLREGGK